jgi:hypothetical protein
VGIRQGKRVVPADSQYTNYYSFARFGLRHQNQRVGKYSTGGEAQYIPSSNVFPVSEAVRPSQVPFTIFSQVPVSSHHSNSVGQQSGKDDGDEALCVPVANSVATSADRFAECFPSTTGSVLNRKQSSTAWDLNTLVPTLSQSSGYNELRELALKDYFDQLSPDKETSVMRSSDMALSSPVRRLPSQGKEEGPTNRTENI